MDIVAHRKSLIPRWIKVFGWLFVVMASSVPIIWIVFPFLNLDQPAAFEIFGLSYVGSPYALGALLIQVIILFLGVSAYGLLFGKNWGLAACIANGYVGLAICCVTMFLTGFSSIRLEPLLQIPYLKRLHSVSAQWHANEQQT